MIAISKVLKENNLKTHSYKKIGKTILVDTEIGKIIAKNKTKSDIYNYLDQVIRYLEAIERIANVFGMGNVMHKCKKLIRLIEG